jgi:hypothetical protein
VRILDDHRLVVVDVAHHLWVLLMVELCFRGFNDRRAVS